MFKLKESGTTVHREHIAGLVAPVHTPMGEDGSLRLERVPGIVDHLERSGVVGLFVCGSTGEGLSLAVDERKDVAARYAEAAAGRLRVIVHVGHNSLAEARKLAAHAQKLDVDAIALSPPNYFKLTSADVAARCLADVSQAAPDLPIYYYHIPVMTGVFIKIIDLLRIAEAECPKLVGVKFTFEDFDDLRSCLAFADGRYDILFGSDEILLSALEVGVRGAIGSSYNYAAPLYLRLIDAFGRGDADEARKLQQRAASLIHIVHRHGGACCHKAMMKQIGIDCGPCRLPLVTLSVDEEKALEADLREIGFFEWIQ